MRISQSEQAIVLARFALLMRNGGERNMVITIAMCTQSSGSPAYFSVSHNSWFSFLCFFMDFVWHRVGFAINAAIFNELVFLLWLFAVVFLRIFLSLVREFCYFSRFWFFCCDFADYKHAHATRALLFFLHFILCRTWAIYLFSHSQRSEVKWVFAACRMDFTRLNCMIVSQFVCLSVHFNRWACIHSKKQQNIKESSSALYS